VVGDFDQGQDFHSKDFTAKVFIPKGLASGEVPGFALPLG
jgi:hypothetical protein